MSREPIIPMGGSGLDPTKGFQERNLENLLKVLENKEAQKTLQVLAEVPREQWADIKESTHNIKAIVEGGGIDTIIADFKGHIVTTIEENIDAQLAPIYNEIDAIINKVITQFFVDWGLDKLANDTAAWLSDYSTGSFLGAMVGGVWGKGGEVVGAIVGAAFEQWLGIGEKTMAAQLADIALKTELTLEEMEKWNELPEFIRQQFGYKTLAERDAEILRRESVNEVF